MDTLNKVVVVVALFTVACGGSKASTTGLAGSGTSTANASSASEEVGSRLNAAPGQLNAAQAQTLLTATAPATVSSEVTTAAGSQVGAAVAAAFSTSRASSVQVLSDADVANLTTQITALVTASINKDAYQAAASWNTLAATLGQIKAARLAASQLALDTSATSSSQSLLQILGNGGTDLVTNVLGILAAPISAVQTLASSAVATASSAVSSITTNTSNVLAGTLAVGQAALTLDPAQVASAAQRLVGTVLSFVY